MSGISGRLTSLAGDVIPLPLLTSQGLRHKWPPLKRICCRNGEAGIRTLGTLLGYNALAKRIINLEVAHY
jgi:hypothetical protein